jgi:hypothetical protein
MTSHWLDSFTQALTALKQSLDLLSYVFAHLDQRRLGVFETFARQLFRRVYAEFAAAGDFASGMVDHVGRAISEETAALRIGVGAEVEEDFAGVVDVHFAHPPPRGDIW